MDGFNWTSTGEDDHYCQWKHYNAECHWYGDDEWFCIVKDVWIDRTLLHTIGEGIVLTDLETARRVCQTVMAAAEEGIHFLGWRGGDQGDLNDV
jgi:hypothetical protein